MAKGKAKAKKINPSIASSLVREQAATIARLTQDLVALRQRAAGEKLASNAEIEIGGRWRDFVLAMFPTVRERFRGTWEKGRLVIELQPSGAWYVWDRDSDDDPSVLSASTSSCCAWCGAKLGKAEGSDITARQHVLGCAKAPWAVLKARMDALSVAAENALGLGGLDRVEVVQGLMDALAAAKAPVIVDGWTRVPMAADGSFDLSALGEVKGGESLHLKLHPSERYGLAKIEKAP